MFWEGVPTRKTLKRGFGCGGVPKIPNGISKFSTLQLSHNFIVHWILCVTSQPPHTPLPPLSSPA